MLHCSVITRLFGDGLKIDIYFDPDTTLLAIKKFIAHLNTRDKLHVRNVL